MSIEQILSQVKGENDILMGDNRKMKRLLDNMNAEYKRLKGETNSSENQFHALQEQMINHHSHDI